MPAEEDRAQAYREQQARRAANDRRRARQLAGNPAAARRVAEAWAPLRPGQPIPLIDERNPRG